MDKEKENIDNKNLEKESENNTNDKKSPQKTKKNDSVDLQSNSQINNSGKNSLRNSKKEDSNPITCKDEVEKDSSSNIFYLENLKFNDFDETKFMFQRQYNIETRKYGRKFFFL